MNGKRKRLLSLITALACALIAIGAPVAAGASNSGITTVFCENFDSVTECAASNTPVECGSITLTGESNGTSKIANYIKHSDDNPIYGSMLKYEQTITDAKKAANLFIDFDDVSADGDNSYAEVSYDVQGLNTGNANIVMHLIPDDATTQFAMLAVDKNGNVVLNNNSTNYVASLGRGKNLSMMNIRIQINLSDKTVTKIWIDGVLYELAAPVSCLNDVRIGRMRFEIRGMAATNGILLDNISLIKYTSADGSSLAADKTALKAKISETYIASADRTEVKNAVSVYRDAAATQAEVDAAVSAIENMQPETMTVIASESFDGGVNESGTYSDFTATYETKESTGKTASWQTYTLANPVYGNMLEFSDKSVVVAGSNNFSNLFLNINKKDAISYDDGSYAELSYDIQGADINKACSVVTVVGDSTGQNAMTFAFDKNAGIVLNNAQPALKSYTDKTNESLVHVSVIFDTANKKITSIKIDGEEIIPEPSTDYDDDGNEITVGGALDWQSGSAKLERIRFYAGTKGVTGKTVRVDNLKLITFKSDDGTSPSADKAALRKAISDNYTLAASLTGDKLAGFNAAIENAVALCKDARAEQADVDAAAAALAAYGAEKKLLAKEAFDDDVLDGFTLSPDNTASKGTISYPSEGSKAYGRVFSFMNDAAQTSVSNVFFNLKEAVNFDDDKILNISLDLKGIGTGGSNGQTVNVQLRGSGASGLQIGLQKNGTVAVGAATTTGILTTNTDFANVSVSINLATKAVEKVLVNGTAVTLPENAAYAANVLDSIRLFVGRAGNYGFMADNIIVASHSADDSIADSSALKAALANAAKEIEKFERGETLSAAKYDAFETLCENAALLCGDINAEASEIAQAAASISAETEKLSALAGKELYNIDGLIINNGESDVLCANGKINGVKLTKNDSLAKEATLVIAVYGENGLLDLRTVRNLSDLAEGSHEITFDSEITLPESISGVTCKGFIWTNLGTMLPFGSTGAAALAAPAYSLSLDGESVLCDAAAYPDGSGIIVPAKNLLNKANIIFTDDNGSYRAEREDGAYFTAQSGSKNAVVNGEEYTLSAAPYAAHGVVAMLPSDVLAKAFGMAFEKDNNAKAISVTDNYSPISWESAPGGMISFDAGINDISYTLSGISENADIEVYYKGTNTANHRNAYEEAAYFHKAQKPQYIGGAFYGAFDAEVQSNVYYVRIKVTENGSTKYYSSSVRTTYMNTNEQAFKNADKAGLVLNATYENISYSLVSSEAAVKIKYRKSGTSTMNEALAPYRDDSANQYRGSITGLSAGTKYYVQAFDASGNAVTELTAVDTMPETVQYTDVPLSSIVGEYGGGSIMLTNIRGTSSEYKRIYNDTGRKITATPGAAEAIMLDRCEYVILDGFEVSGGTRNGIKVTHGCKNVRISGCTVSGWGRVGVLNTDDDKTYRFMDSHDGVYRIDGDIPDHEAGIDISGCKYITIEKCTITNPRGTANRWNGPEWTKVHPFGPVGIYTIDNRNIVIRYNDIIGTENHLFNDGIEGGYNGLFYGGIAKDSDIYGNLITGCADDGAEIDGGQNNVRFYENKITNTLCGLSTAATITGPSYVFRNIVLGLYNDGITIGSAIKAGGGSGTAYILNNTLDGGVHAIRDVGLNTSTELKAQVINNVLIAPDSVYAYRNASFEEGTDVFKNNLYSGRIYLGSNAADSSNSTDLSVYDSVTNRVTPDEDAWNGYSAAIPGFTAEGEPVGAFSGRVKNASLPYRR